MKPLILATDFSKPAQNAADYAAQLAKKTGAELIIVHVWSLPVMTGETIAFPYSIDEIRKGNLERVQKEAERLEKKWHITVRAEERMGFLQDELNELCRKEKASFVVMGMAEVKGERWLGCSASSFAMHTRTPVFIIPEGTTYHRIRKVLLASDFKTDHHWHELDALKEFCDQQEASLHILHVSDNLEATAEEHQKHAASLEKRLGTKPEQWHFGSGEVVMEVGEEAKELHADLIAMVHHQLPWYKQLFHISLTKAASFETHRPMVILPEPVK